MGVFVDETALRKAAEDLDEESKFGRFAVGDGDLMKRPSVDSEELCSDLKELRIGKALKKTLNNWKDKCGDWGDSVETYRQNLSYYADVLKGVDAENAEGMSPLWIDDVPDESENKKQN